MPSQHSRNGQHYKAYLRTDFRDIPQRDMLLPHPYEEIAGLVRKGADEAVIKASAERIRMELKPAFGKERFSFEDELEGFYRENLSTPTAYNFE